jgi:hypothetical protein
MECCCHTILKHFRYDLGQRSMAHAGNFELGCILFRWPLSFFLRKANIDRRFLPSVTGAEGVGVVVEVFQAIMSW